MILGDIIKQYRREHGLSQDAIAERAQLSKAYISILERNINPKTGEPPVPSVKTIMAIARAVNMDFDAIFEQLDDDLKISINEQLPKSSPPTTPLGFEAVPEMENVPLIGSIACGTPILAEENIESYIGVPAAWRADFALTCHGDSMAPTIQDGDIVCIRKTTEVEQGAITAVRIGEEATLKHFYKSGNVVQLIADNPAVCPPMAYSGQQLEEIAIEGIAVGLCRGLHK